MTSFRHYRSDHGWHYGWTGDRWWLSICRSGLDMFALDVGTWRIRWAGPTFRPLFSERYGYTPVHKVGRLAFIHTPRRKR